MRVVVGSCFSARVHIVLSSECLVSILCVFFFNLIGVYTGSVSKFFVFQSCLCFQNAGPPGEPFCKQKGCLDMADMGHPYEPRSKDAVAGKGTGKFGLGPLACERLKLGAFGNQSGRPWGRYTSDPYRKPKGKRQENGKPGKPDTSNLSLPGWAVAASSSQSPSPCR